MSPILVPPERMALLQSSHKKIWKLAAVNTGMVVFVWGINLAGAFVWGARPGLGLAVFDALICCIVFVQMIQSWRIYRECVLQMKGRLFLLSMDTDKMSALGALAFTLPRKEGGKWRVRLWYEAPWYNWAKRAVPPTGRDQIVSVALLKLWKKVDVAIESAPDELFAKFLKQTEEVLQNEITLLQGNLPETAVE